jgi:hypothetical protein
MKLLLRLLYNLLLLICVLSFKKIALKPYYKRVEPIGFPARLPSHLPMGFGDTIAAKFTGILELVVGQSEITEKNIEDTLKVSLCFSSLTSTSLCPSRTLASCL